MARKIKPKPVSETPKFESKAGETVASEISRLCTEFRALTLEYRKVEDEQKERNKKLDSLSSRLVELITMSDLQPPFYPEGGGRISVKSDISVKQEDKDTLCHSLEALGLQDLIQPTINTNSLRSVVKERLENHQELPEGISITPYKKATFTAN